MKNLLRSSILTLAGTAVLATSAMASLQDAEVAIDRAEDNRTLAVRYTGAPVALVELRINGVSISARSVNDDKTAGETNFELEPDILQDGDNRVEIRLFDADGKLVGTEKSVITVSRDEQGPVFIARPLAGATVSGPVEVKVGFKTQIRDAYVSFFVNGEFKSLRNVPPYNYLWDTTRVANGWHQVQAWVVDETNQTYKTQAMRVFVHNPGGRTDRNELPIMPDPTEADLIPSVNPSEEVTSGMAGVKETTAGGTASPASGPVEPNDAAMISESVSDIATGEASGTKAPDYAATVVTGQRDLTPTGQRSVPSLTENNTEPVLGGEANPTLSAEAETESADLIALAPNTSAVTQAASTAALMSITFGQRVPDIGAFTIAINNSPVEFDVEPRVEQGVALTPFRHLFEHVGGKVDWEHDTKTVEAVGLGQEVWLRIGDPFAVLNDEQLRLEMAPFIDQGRTIVPLSFVSKVLDVNVLMDPESGHVFIESRE